MNDTAVAADTQVSVVIVCYNQARYLREAIESALAQTFRNVEVLVVDDGSTDETAAVARSFRDVRYLYQENRGLAAARNTGLRESSGRFVVFLDADDRLLPNALDSGIACFRRLPSAGFVYGAYQNIHSDGSPASTPPPEYVKRDYYWHLLRGNVIAMHATVMYARVAIAAAGGFNESLPACEDYELYLRMARCWPVKRHEHCVAEYRRHDRNMSLDHAFMLRTVLSVLKAERRRVPDRRHRLALKTGIAAWREYYTARWLDQWKERKSMRELVPLAVADPRGILRRGGRFLARGIRRLALFGNRPDLRGLEPHSRRFGLDRGQPIDRYYIESFLAEHAAAVHGRVLEVGDDSYSRRFGRDRVTHQDVLHVVPGYPGATIIADLNSSLDLPAELFDCIIFTQTLHYILNVDAALYTLARILKPGGTLLLTAPGISQVCRDQADLEADCWRFTESALRKLLLRHFPASSCEVRTYGNVLAAAAFLYGLAAHELRQRELDHFDPDFPVTVAAAVFKR